MGFRENSTHDSNDDGRLRGDSLNALKSPKAQSYFDKSISIRLLIAIAFGLCIFFFLHFQELYVEPLELGTTAKRYVVAQVDFAFPDDEATIILKQEASREIKTIYRLHPDQVHQQITDFQRYVTQETAGAEKWGELVKEDSLADLALAMNLMTDGLLQARFTDAKTTRRIDELPTEELPIGTDYFFVFLPPADDMPSKLPPSFWEAINKSIFSENTIPDSAIGFIQTYFQAQSWQFDEDQGLEYTLRKLVQMRIPEIYTPIAAGDRIIDRGEKVNSKHVAQLQSMKEKMGEKRNLLDPFTLLGSFLMSLLFLFVASIYLREGHQDIYTSNRKLALLVTVCVLDLLFAKLIELFLIKNATNLLDFVRFPLFVPFAGILLASLMNVRIAAFATIFLSILFAMALSVEAIPFLVINLVTGMIAVLGTRAIRRRKEIFLISGKAWLASLIVVLGINLYEGTAFTSSFFSDFISTFIFMLLTSIAVLGVLPLLESLFQIMTDITLMEYMDPSNEILRRLTIEAPGTHQHSMVVGNLSEAAAAAIGANGLFCRVATQYHDIGKLTNPGYFTENQMGGVDMHQLLTPLESSQVIIAHVSEGVALARKVGLPEPFIDIIKEHHGTTLVYYFYAKQLEVVEGDKSKVDERTFRYSGPRPTSKESTIIMIADTLEAASRSLDVFNEKTVTGLVNTLIAQKMADGQFDESELTFAELKEVRKTIVKTLLAASHPRIKYPPHHPGEEG